VPVQPPLTIQQAQELSGGKEEWERLSRHSVCMQAVQLLGSCLRKNISHLRHSSHAQLGKAASHLHSLEMR
jgi:hypothetical protein